MARQRSTPLVVYSRHIVSPDRCYGCSEAAVCQEGGFREDLFFRINAMTLDVPPLRERLDDIKALALHFVNQANEVNERNIRGMDKASLQRLLRHSWPGNVRELRNVLERAVVVAHENVITVEDLPTALRGATERPEEPDTDGDPTPASPVDSGAVADLDARSDLPVGSLQEEMDRVEKRLITRALRESGWDRKETARPKDAGARDQPQESEEVMR